MPFLKWAGGKRWLLNAYPDIFPAKIKSYIEPFVGSGAVFFSLKPQSALLADSNAELIGAYEEIKRDWESVYCQLEQHQFHHNKQYYYRVRESNPDLPAARAARFIYLNRTCWNGLYRVNLKGKFNVPKGTKSNVLLESDDFELISKLLQDVKLEVSDFEATIDKATSGTFIFVDPPYTVRHNNNGFVKYNEKLFSWDDQCRLKRCLVKAKARGASVLCTNADHSSIRTLYGEDFCSTFVSRASVISGDPLKRGRYQEVLFTC